MEHSLTSNPQYWCTNNMWFENAEVNNDVPTISFLVYSNLLRYLQKSFHESIWSATFHSSFGQNKESPDIWSQYESQKQQRSAGTYLKMEDLSLKHCDDCWPPLNAPDRSTDEPAKAHASADTEHPDPNWQCLMSPKKLNQLTNSKGATCNPNQQKTYHSFPGRQPVLMVIPQQLVQEVYCLHWASQNGIYYTNLK